MSRNGSKTEAFKEAFKILVKPVSGKTLNSLENYFDTKSNKVKVWNSISELEWAPDTRWPVLIFSTLGRIGNCLTVFGTALTLHRLYPNITVGVDKIVYQNLEKILHEETLFKISVFSANFFRNGARNFKTIHPDYSKGDFHSHISKEIDSTFNGNPSSPYMIMHFEGYTDIFTFKAEIKYLRKHIRLKDQLIDKAQNYLISIKNKFYEMKNVTFIGFHIRRGDYVTFQERYFGTNLPDNEFYKYVLLFYREKFETPVFILSSQDTTHLKEKFADERNVHITDNLGSEDDFAILASCNHSAMTVGSFGFWASFLAGGDVLYARINNNRRIAFTDGVVGLPGFIPIDIT